jgi:D-alanyl-D-alanine carboxypeptidase
VAIHQQTPLGPSLGHGGTIPGYVSSLRYYADHRVAVAFQINTDVDLDEALSRIELRLARVVVATSRQVERPDGA